MTAQTSREFLKEWIKAQPKKGYGQALRLAEAIGCSSVLVSQFLSGTRLLSLEQGEKATRYMKLSKLETRYFLLLLQKDRASTSELINFFEQDLSGLRRAALKVSERVKVDLTMPPDVRLEFYSNWVYSAIRLLTDTAQFSNPEALASRLQLNRDLVVQALEFLTSTGLCRWDGKRYHLGPSRTHLEASNPLVVTRQLQWRTKAFSNMQMRNPEDLFYTGPMAISKEDYLGIRESLVRLIVEVGERARGSKSEDLYCLNVDAFRV
jgi:uncharacterized protein (TIGR02147 family)